MGEEKKGREKMAQGGGGVRLKNVEFREKMLCLRFPLSRVEMEKSVFFLWTGVLL